MILDGERSRPQPELDGGPSTREGSPQANAEITPVFSICQGLRKLKHMYLYYGVWLLNYIPMHEILHYSALPSVRLHYMKLLHYTTTLETNYMRKHTFIVSLTPYIETHIHAYIAHYTSLIHSLHFPAPLHKTQRTMLLALQLQVLVLTCLVIM